MTVNLFTTIKQAALVFSVLFASCTTELYEPKPDPDPTPGPTGPVDNVFTTNTTKKITVNVEDAYDGKYYYTVEVFMGNPAVEEDAKMIAGSGQKMNSKVPYSVNISLPKVMKVLHIRVTDPFKRAAVYAFDVVEGDMVCNIGNSGTSTKSSSTQLRSEVADFPAIDYSYEKLTYTKLSGSQNVTLTKNTVYVIEPGTSFTGSVKFPEEGNVSLYVAGTWGVDMANNMQLESNTHVYVLNGGNVGCINGTGRLFLVGTSSISIQKGGKFGQDGYSSEFVCHMTNDSRIVNEGKTDFIYIEMDNNASIYNSDHFATDFLSTQTVGNKVVNTHEFEARIFEITYGVVNNYCKFDVDSKLEILRHGEINLMAGAFMNADFMYAQGLTINMDAKSMWVGKEADFWGEKNFVKGGDTDYALFKVDEIYTNYSGIVLAYQNKINVECPNHPDNSDAYGPHYEQGPDVAFSIGQGFVEIDGDDCNGNTGNQNPGEGGGDNTEEYEETATLPYVYMFEDNWPKVGDYDMNDLVIGIQIKNKKLKDKTVSAKVIATLYAAGATRQLGAAFQLDGIGSSLVPGTEAGQDNAVLWLFKDAHEVLGATERKPINTSAVNLDPKKIELDLQFTTPLSEVITADNLNLFVVTGNMDSDKRNEIHIAGFKGTKKAAKSDLCTEIYTSTESGLMWGLCIAQDNVTSYPKEYVYVGDAYPGFGEWIKENGLPAWYKITSANKDKVIQF